MEHLIEASEKPKLAHHKYNLQLPIAQRGDNGAASEY
jgi:hypothetical protein